jgi:hypothetical protein
MEHPMDAVAEALYNPLDVREGLTLREYVPPEIRDFLREHWLSFPPLSPVYYYVFALLYLIGGE